MPGPGEQRRLALQKMSADVLDVLIVGGGIVGAGIARDAAMRGLSVGLVEQNDFAFGTSSRSSRLLHGGLRYLAQGRLGLVRQAGREKNILRHIAPHLSQPLRFVLPTYARTEWPLWQMRIGVKLYDWLSAERETPRSRVYTRQQMLQLLPTLDARGLTGGVEYGDSLTSDSRLVLDTLRSAERYGLAAANYTRFIDAQRTGAFWRCRGEDLLTNDTFEVRARSIVNAAGPWAQHLGRSRLKLRLTKGVHLVLDRDRLPVPSAVVLTEQSRVLFLLPWGQRLIVGTTDTDWAGPPEKLTTQQADIDYLLAAVNRAFPSAGFTQHDVLSHWVGLRPLPARRFGGQPSEISRSHRIRMQRGWLDVAGGKLTTYRHIAERAVDHLVRYLRQKVEPCRTDLEPLLPPEQATMSSIVPPPFSREAVEHYVNNEWALTVEDVMLRRTSWQHYLPEAASAAEQVRQWMKDMGGG